MDEFLINTTTAGDQHLPGVCGLQGTQFAVVWADSGDNTIKGKLFGINGVATSTEMLINLPTPPTQPAPRRQVPAIVEYGAGLKICITLLLASCGRGRGHLRPGRIRR